MQKRNQNFFHDYGYATIVKYKCKFPIPKSTCFAQNADWLKEIFVSTFPIRKEKFIDLKVIISKTKLIIFLKLRGLNFDIILVEGVISVDNTLNEFVDYEKKYQITFSFQEL